MASPRVLANRYRLEAVIGEGGMGIVHRAIDQQLERAVAIKVLIDSDDTAVERFLTEAKRTAAVRHPCIVEVFDVGQDGADAYLVMELLEGETLAARLARGAVPADEAVVIGAQICDALAAAHDAGLVHRDLKPANVFLESAERETRVKLLDFGIAKRIDGNTARTDPSMIVGTLEYLSPEQIRGEHLDGRADLYALGMTLYRMLTGTLPFTGDNVATLIHQHLSVAPVTLRERAPTLAIPPTLDTAVLRLLAKDPSGRPSSARDAKNELLGAPHAVLHTRSEEPRRGSERIVDFGQEAAPASLELELDTRGPTRGPSIVPVAPLVPLPPQAPLSVTEATAPLPGWLAPLATVPPGTSKRVVGYSLFALFLHVVFFSGSVGPTVALLVLAALGGVAFWAHHRATR